MIFSYGFLENEVKDARQLFLGLDIPDDDPLKLAKRTFCNDAPGVRLYLPAGSEKTSWESPFVWWSCVNEEDGLDFHVLQTNDGKKELKATWKGNEIGPSDSLRDLIAADPLWDIFQLRAVVIVLERLETQLSLLQETEKSFPSPSAPGTGIRSDIYQDIMKLRKLETDLLERGIRDLVKTVREYLPSLWGDHTSYPIEALSTGDNSHFPFLLVQRDNLITSDTVTAYFSQQAEGVEEDFS